MLWSLACTASAGCLPCQQPTQQGDMGTCSPFRAHVCLECCFGFEQAVGDQLLRPQEGLGPPGWTGPLQGTIHRPDSPGPRACSRSEELGKEAVREQIGRVVGGKCLDLPRPRRIGCTPGRIGVMDPLQYCWIAPGAAASSVGPAF